MLKPTLLLITDIFKIKDPLIGLFSFSTLINLISIAIFLPFLNPFVKLFEKFFKNTDASAAAFIGLANVKEPVTALDLFRRETEYFIYNSMLFNLSKFEIDMKLLQDNPDFKSINEKRNFFH